MTTTWDLNAGETITRAYRILGNLEPPWTPSDDQMTQGIIAFNAMLKGWQTDGINLYRQQQVSWSITAGTQQYNITPLILGLEEARWVVQPAPNLYERPLGIYSYIDYMNLPNKLSQASSGPSVIMLDKGSYTSSVWIWPVPAVSGTINATVGRTVNDITLPSDITDYPREWTEGAIYNLADRLMEDSAMAAADPATAQRITQRAVAFYDKLLNFDRPASVYVRPWGRKGSGRFWR